MIQAKTKEFKSAVFPPGYDPLAPILKKKKRKASDDSSDRPAKKAAVTLDDEMVQEAINDGKVIFLIFYIRFP